MLCSEGYYTWAVGLSSHTSRSCVKYFHLLASYTLCDDWRLQSGHDESSGHFWLQRDRKCTFPFHSLCLHTVRVFIYCLSRFSLKVCHITTCPTVLLPNVTNLTCCVWGIMFAVLERQLSGCHGKIVTSPLPGKKCHPSIMLSMSLAVVVDHKQVCPST